jgi:hypothetical protein
MQALCGTNRSALRYNLSFYWRPQPVILVSEHGRSTTLRARLLQPSTSVNKSGSFNSVIYHDQVVLENGKWRLWSITIDEFYWQSPSWKEGWAMAKPRNSTHSIKHRACRLDEEVPARSFPQRCRRERKHLWGGSGRSLQWPDIQRMWFQYRYPVSGREPEWYWPGCVPCQVRKDWSLEANGYQEPWAGGPM